MATLQLQLPSRLLSFCLAPKSPRHLLPPRRSRQPGDAALRARLYCLWLLLLLRSQPAMLLRRGWQAPRQLPRAQAALERRAALLLGSPLAAVAALVLGAQGLISATTHWLWYFTRRAAALPSLHFCRDFESWLARSTAL